MIRTKHRSHLDPQERELVSQLYGLIGKSGILRASFVRMRRRCGKDYCRCARSKRNWHSSWYIIQRHEGRPRMKSISHDREFVAREWIERYQKIKGLLDRISSIHWEKLAKAA